MSLRPREQERRKAGYKPSVAEDARRKREESLIEIRKSKRDENLAKKRREGMIISQQQQQPIPQFLLENMPALKAALWADNFQTQLEAITQFRKLLSMEKNPPIQEVINAGVVPRLIEYLQQSDFHQLQFEAAWALTNIASGTQEQTFTVINLGAVPIFVHLLSSPSADVCEQAVWALGNIAGDSTGCRDLVLNQGALMPLLAQLNESATISMLRNATWTLSNLFRGKPPPLLDAVKPALPVLAKLINSLDDEVLADASWALSYLSDVSNDRIQALLEANVCARMVELLLYPSDQVVVPALRTVGNIVTGDDVQTQVAISCNVLPRLLALIASPKKKSIKKEACWAISNITAGNKEQIQAVIHSNIIPPLIDLCSNAEFDVQKEALWAISNATSGGTHDQIKYIVKQGCIRPLCDLLICSDPKVIHVALEGLENILRVGEDERNLGNTDVNVYVTYIEDAEGLEKIEKLQAHDNPDIYSKAVSILGNYWEEDGDEGNEAVGNGSFSTTGFNFGS